MWCSLHLEVFWSIFKFILDNIFKFILDNIFKFTLALSCLLCSGSGFSESETQISLEPIAINSSAWSTFEIQTSQNYYPTFLYCRGKFYYHNQNYARCPFETLKTSLLLCLHNLEFAMKIFFFLNGQNEALYAILFSVTWVQCTRFGGCRTEQSGVKRSCGMLCS